MKRALKIAVPLAVLALLAGLIAHHLNGNKAPIRLSADFGDTTGLYVGNEVDYLGVPIGTVTAIDRNGTSMRVHLELDAGSQIPADARAVIMQSSLVTDRYIELGPAYTGGPTLADGANIAQDATRSPATIDQITASIDQLVRALDDSDEDTKTSSLGELLSISADTLDGSGERLRRALVEGEGALKAVNGNAEAITSVTHDLATLVTALAERDRTIRRLTRNVATSTHVVTAQRDDLTQTLDALGRLSTIAVDFVRHNRDVLGDDVSKALAVAKVVKKRQASLAEAWDTMPTLAQNIAQAYDFKRKRLRVQFNLQAGPFSSMFRAELCAIYPIPVCSQLFHADGSGALDPLLDALFALFNSAPGGFP